MARSNREMNTLLKMQHSPVMREFVQRIVREALKQERDLDLIQNATLSDTLARELEGRAIKIESTDLSPVHTKVTFADTGEDVPDLRRVEICLDAQTGEMGAVLYRWVQNDCKEMLLERANTTKVEASTLARIAEVK